jgi:hypothetical protein
VAVGKLAAAKVRNRFIATAWIHHASLPRPRGLSVIALSPAADVGRLDASPGNLLLDRLAQQQAPWATAAATAAEGGPGEAGPVERLAPRPDWTYCPTCHRAAIGQPRGRARSRAPT